MHWAEWDRVSLARITAIEERGRFNDVHVGGGFVRSLTIHVDRVLKGESTNLPTTVVDIEPYTLVCGGDDMSAPRTSETLVIYEQKKRPGEDAFITSRRLSWAGRYDQNLRKALK